MMSLYRQANRRHDVPAFRGGSVVWTETMDVPIVFNDYSLQNSGSGDVERHMLKASLVGNSACLA